MQKHSATRLVADAILGDDYRTIIVAGKSYCIMPPTIERIAGMAKCLTDFEEIASADDLMKAMANATSAAKALSWLIAGDESLHKELAKGRIEEIAEGLKLGMELISTQDFMQLSALIKSVGNLIARQR